MGIVLVVALVVVGLVVLTRVVWFIVEAGMNGADLKGDISVSIVRKKLADPSLPSTELRSIAYRTRSNASLWYQKITQHPNCYPGLKEWMDELNKEKEYVPKPGSNNTLILDPTWKKRIKNFPEPPAPEPGNGQTA